MKPLNALVVMSLPTRQALRPLLTARRDLCVEIEVGTLLEARQVLSMLKFDLVLLETSLTGEDGFDLLVAIEPATRVICFVADSADRMRALSFGSLECVSLPVRPAVLAAAMDGVGRGHSFSPFFSGETRARRIVAV